MPLSLHVGLRHQGACCCFDELTMENKEALHLHGHKTIQLLPAMLAY